jgi:hypothetical protein
MVNEDLKRPRLALPLTCMFAPLADGLRKAYLLPQ